MYQTKVPEELCHCSEAAGYRQHYEVNEDIYMQGDDTGRIYFIRRGRVRAYYVTPQGVNQRMKLLKKTGYPVNPPFFHNMPDRSAWQQLHRSN